MWHVRKFVEIWKSQILSLVYYLYWVSYVSSLQYSTAMILYCPNEASLLTKSSTKMDHHSTSEESPSVQCRWKRKRSAAVGVGRHMPRHPTDLPVTLKWYQDTTILQIWCTSQHLQVDTSTFDMFQPIWNVVLGYLLQLKTSLIDSASTSLDTLQVLENN